MITDKHMDRHIDGQSNNRCPRQTFQAGDMKSKPVFRRMHVAPAKANLERWMDEGQSNPYVALCFTGATKIY